MGGFRTTGVVWCSVVWCGVFTQGVVGCTGVVCICTWAVHVCTGSVVCTCIPITVTPPNTPPHTQEHLRRLTLLVAHHVPEYAVGHMVAQMLATDATWDCMLCGAHVLRDILVTAHGVGGVQVCTQDHVVGFAQHAQHGFVVGCVFF